MKSVCIAFILLSNLIVCAQLDEKSKREFNIVPSLSINNDFNAQDWIFGISAGVEDIGYKWGARLGFNLRPFYKKVQIKEGTIIRQYREQKYFLSLDLDKRFLKFDIIGAEIQFFAGLRSGFLFGNYKGTREDAKAFGVLAPMCGLCYNLDDAFFVKVGYCLFSDRLNEVSDSRITATVVFAL